MVNQMYHQRDINDLGKMKSELKTIKRQMTKLLNRQVVLEQTIYEISSINEFYEGFPLHIYDGEWHSNTCNIDISNVPDNGLCARLYHVATEPKKVNRWGINISDYSTDDLNKRDRWLGFDFKKNEALKICKDWVIGKPYEERA
jgi:hypothetical protein